MIHPAELFSHIERKRRSRGGLLFGQALVPAEMAAQIAADGCGCDGRQLVVQVGIRERLAGDSEAFQTTQDGPETCLGLDAAEDEMRMLVTWRDERTCNFDARVANLNRLLRMR